MAVAGGVWLALSNAVGLFVGAWITSRCGLHPEPWRLRTSALQPLAIWGMAFVLALVIAGFSGTGFMGALVRGAAEQPMAAAETIDASIAPLPGDGGRARTRRRWRPRPRPTPPRRPRTPRRAWPAGASSTCCWV